MTSEFIQAIAASGVGGIIGAVVGGAIGWYGSYHVQFRLHRRLRRIDSLRQAFSEYLNLASDYWHNAEHDLHKRRGQEGRMIVAQLMIVTEYGLLAKDDRRARKSYTETKADRLRLWDAATGGCFGQADWKPCPERALAAGRAVAKIVGSLE